jgi:hypothetical protein
VFGLLAAAAGPLSVRDLAELAADSPAPLPGQTRRVRRLVTEQAARSLEPIGLSGHTRYQFAHDLLMEYAQADEDLGDPQYRDRIHRRAKRWQDAGWPVTADPASDTPRYLLDTYPATLATAQLGSLVGDVGWVDAAIRSVGVEPVLADLRQAAGTAGTAVAAMLATVEGQAHHLRDARRQDDPGYVPRQLCLHAAELAADDLASELRARLRLLPDPGLVPLWTTRRVSPALSAEPGGYSVNGVPLDQAKARSS